MFATRFVCSSTAPLAARVVAVARAGGASRGVSSMACAPAEKLRNVFEEYRRAHFSRETPVRFRKELLKAASAGQASGEIQVDRLNEILINIGRPDQLLSEEEKNVLLQEAGPSCSTTRCMSTAKMIDLM